MHLDFELFTKELYNNGARDFWQNTLQRDELVRLTGYNVQSTIFDQLPRCTSEIFLFWLKVNDSVPTGQHALVNDAVSAD